jgi:hypothetical protein
MAVLSFARTEPDTVSLRKAVFRMIVSRARLYLPDPADSEQLNVFQAMDGISFDLLPAAQRERLVEAVYQGTWDLRQDIIAGRPVQEPVRPGIEDKLGEILALLARFRG